MTEDEIMLTSILDCRRIDLLLNDTQLTKEQQNQLNSMAERRANGEPLQYIIGHCDFMGTKRNCSLNWH